MGCLVESTRPHGDGKVGFHITLGFCSTFGQPTVQETPLEKDKYLRGLIFRFYLRLFSCQVVIGSQGPLPSWQLSALFCDKGKDLQ